MRHVTLFKSLLILAALGAMSAFGTAADAGSFDHSHAGLAKVLKQHSRKGFVDYKALRASPGILDAYLSELAAPTVAEEKGWTREQRLAFWINAYNAFTIKAIVDAYPPDSTGFIAKRRFGKRSIRHIKDVWKKENYWAAGRKVSLNHIEHEVLRKGLNEPRIHFAIVCASIGCPPLWGKPFTAAGLDKQLEDNIAVFLSRKENFILDKANGRISLSPILKWFSKDFDRFDDGTMGHYPAKARGGLSFLSSRLSKSQSRVLRSGVSFGWIDYDWGLNEL